MYIIGSRNIGSQTVLPDGVVNIGSSYRRFSKKDRCGVDTYSLTSNGITLQQEGVYHITATLVGSGDVAGDITVQVFENGQAIDGVFSTETITTPTTELRTFVLDYYVLVDKDCILGRESTLAKTISLVNTSETVTATFTSVVLNIDKVV